MPGVRTGRKTDLRQDVDALTKSVASVRATVENVYDILNRQLSENRDAVRALEGLGGRPPLRVVDVLVGRDLYLGTPGKRVTIHWTQFGLLLCEEGKRFETQDYHMVLDFPATPRLRP